MHAQKNCVIMQNVHQNFCNLLDLGQAMFTAIPTWERLDPERKRGRERESERDNNVLLIVSCLSQALSSVIL